MIVSDILPVYFSSQIEQTKIVLVGPFEACSSSPCENSGTCVDVNVDTFVCVCRDGYFGTNCGESEFVHCIQIVQEISMYNYFFYLLKPRNTTNRLTLCGSGRQDNLEPSI